MATAECLHEPEVEFNTIVSFNKTRSQLTQDLHKLSDYAQHLNLRESISLINDVVERLNGGTFAVVVVGEFKIGKSSFLNALLGAPIFPVDVVPTTATLNRATYGLQSRVEVRFKDDHREEVGLNDLPKFVTKLLDGGQVAQEVDEAVVYYNAPYLMNNVDIIDTPGLNDDQVMTEATLRVLPRTDAAILVISALAPLSMYTREFLEGRLLTSDLGRVIFVVTQIGRLADEDSIDRVVGYIEKQIREKVIERARADYGEGTPEFETYKKKIGKPRVFGVDSLWALQAKQTNDTQLMEKSRFPQFVAGLERFLTEDRGAIVLQVPVNRLIASGGEILNTIRMREAAMEMDRAAFQEKYDKAMAEIASLREREAREMRAVDEQREQAKQRALPLLHGIDDRIRMATLTAARTVPLTDTEVKGKAAQEKAAAKLHIAVTSAARAEAERAIADVSREVNRSFAEATDRLQGFVGQVEDAIKDISIDLDKQGGGGDVGAAAIAAITGLGGIWNGYRQAGVKGAIVGGAGSFGTAFAAGILCSLVGLPLTLPVLLAATLVSWFAGARVAELAFAGSRAERFREQILAELEKQLARQHVEAQMAEVVEEHIGDLFNSLKDRTAKELHALLANTQQTLDQIRLDKEKATALSEEDRRELADIRQGTTNILEHAGLLNKTLVQMLSA